MSYLQGLEDAKKVVQNYYDNTKHRRQIHTINLQEIIRFIEMLEEKELKKMEKYYERQG